MHSMTACVSAFLLLALQPMLGKSLLPHFGGAAQVWALCLVFFQSLLLAGYLYSSALIRAGRKVQLAIHLLLCALACAMFWLSPSSPLLRVALYALPLFVLSAHTLLLISRYQGHRPMRLYAASNAGCLAAVLSYSLVIEPLLGLSTQLALWQGMFILCLVGVALCAARAKPRPAPDRVPAPRRTRWVLEALVPSALLCALTTYLTSFIAAAPMLWLVPLSLYLLSLILPFAGVRLPFLQKIWPQMVLVAIASYIFAPQFPLELNLTVQLLAFFCVSYGLHSQLEEHPMLPLWVAVGGVCGAVFASMLAPLLFNSYLELPLAYAAARFLWRGKAAAAKTEAKRIDLRRELPLLAGLYASFFAWMHWVGSFVVPGLATLLLIKKPWRFALGLCMVLQIALQQKADRHTLHKIRSFYAPLEVRREAGMTTLYNGRIVHGRQNTQRPRVPLSYYNPHSAVGKLLHKKPHASVGAIGLGVGAIAGYFEAGQKLTFFEIDPEVIAIAEDPKLFTFLSDARKRGVTVKVVPGDARVSLVGVEDTYSVLVVDAFQGGSIPAHLLTKEAVELYLSRLSAKGVLAFHVSSPHFDYAKLFRGLAREMGLSVSQVKSQVKLSGADPATWVLLSRTRLPQPLAAGPRVAAWTDEYANVWGLF